MLVTFTFFKGFYPATESKVFHKYKAERAETVVHLSAHSFRGHLSESAFIRRRGLAEILTPDALPNTTLYFGLGPLCAS